jgi:hypothetical protein
MHKRKRENQGTDFAPKKSPTDHFLSLSADLNHTRIEFLKVDVETALTFSAIALKSDTDSERMLRNRHNARRGYDTILHFMRNVAFTDDERSFMSNRLKRLKSDLLALGETL